MTEPSGDSTETPRRPVVVPAVSLVALTAVGITALLGGLNETPDAPEPLSLNVVVDQGRFSTKFIGSRVTVEKGEFDFDEDKRFVELVMDVTNKGDETAPVGLPPQKFEQAHVSDSFAGSMVKITPAFPKEAGPFVFARAKGGETRQLHPGVTTQVIVRYRLKENEQPPEKIVVDLAKYEYEPDFLSDVPRWKMVTDEVGDKFVAEIEYRVTMPVEKGDTA
ncbi:hypothetical protein [Nonomuraea basaltis]|uniref:hypothetical protein n=1 Tax=Nonomuraea basaltis TaxID=2495887 RepID=UPI00110C5EDC|nr:hypothetical protein [Nonomuraea basaltis]TMR88388.1 hypothetical protein EJK15_66530 [Nonomuraea basaltis]